MYKDSLHNLGDSMNIKYDYLQAHTYFLSIQVKQSSTINQSIIYYEVKSIVTHIILALAFGPQLACGFSGNLTICLDLGIASGWVSKLTLMPGSLPRMEAAGLLAARRFSLTG